MMAPDGVVVAVEHVLDCCGVARLAFAFDVAAIACAGDGGGTVVGLGDDKRNLFPMN
jgi:hypothetical protein